MLSHITACTYVHGCVHADQDVCLPIREPEDCKLHLQVKQSGCIPSTCCGLSASHVLSGHAMCNMLLRANALQTQHFTFASKVCVTLAVCQPHMQRGNRTNLTWQPKQHALHLSSLKGVCPAHLNIVCSIRTLPTLDDFLVASNKRFEGVCQQLWSFITRYIDSIPYADCMSLLSRNPCCVTESCFLVAHLSRWQGRANDGLVEIIQTALGLCLLCIWYEIAWFCSARSLKYSSVQSWSDTTLCSC